MSRHRFAREGVNTIGRVLEPGSIKWEERPPLAVVWNFDFNDVGSVMGKATDIQREEDGWLTAEITWEKKHQDLVDQELGEMFFLTFYADHVVRERVAGIEHVTSCRLRCISAVLDNPWEGVR